MGATIFVAEICKRTSRYGFQYVLLVNSAPALAEHSELVYIKLDYTIGGEAEGAEQLLQTQNQRVGKTQTPWQPPWPGEEPEPGPFRATFPGFCSADSILSSDFRENRFLGEQVKRIKKMGDTWLTPQAGPPPGWAGRMYEDGRLSIQVHPPLKLFSSSLLHLKRTYRRPACLTPPQALVSALCGGPAGDCLPLAAMARGKKGPAVCSLAAGDISRPAPSHLCTRRLRAPGSQGQGGCHGVLSFAHHRGGLSALSFFSVNLRRKWPTPSRATSSWWKQKPRESPEHPVESGEAPTIATVLISHEPSFWLSSASPTNMQIDLTFATPKPRPPAKPCPPTNQDEYANYPNQDGG
ncbi:hypothetical protein QTO34_001387 [Cnephaeus nilssonii]|uniref:Uncharacterized protein n=1 Tax=Cnephaeus nilssonii TaxID=3371016 RepID=A0AA40HVW2_CNENI|nr:hypothetical protein QTO34_001387 [Eptesicus nilssonii]